MEKKYDCIYVGCTGYNKTGGTELVHQLVYKINYFGGKAKVVYLDSMDGKYLNTAFEGYVDGYVTIDEISDDSRYLLILPETYTRFIDLFHKIDIYIWWMSVDYYYLKRNFRLEVKEKGFIKATLLLWRSILIKKYRRKNIVKLNNMQKVKLHLAQSEYALDFLESNGFENIMYLSDYMNKDYYIQKEEIDINEKENIVLYNPKKGIRFTKKIIGKCPDIKFIPLIDMTNEEIINLMKRAKIYIDFGAHPGKDRMPREAALMLCCVITGRRGAAKYGDVPIDSEYKIEDKRNNLLLIKNKIVECLNEYEMRICDFEKYREIISQEEAIFDDTVQKLFCK